MSAASPSPRDPTIPQPSRSAGWELAAAVAFPGLLALIICGPLLASGAALSPNPDWLEPMRMALLDRRALLEHGQLPLWVPGVDAGLPLLGHPHDLSAGPWLALVLALGPVVGIKLHAVLTLVLAASGLALLARKGLGLDPAACLLAGGLLAVGAALPAELRSGSLPKLQLALVCWPLLGWHLGGRRGAALLGGGLALVMAHAGLTGVVALGFLLAWVLLDRVGAGFAGGPRPTLGQLLGAGALAVVLVAGKAGGSWLILSGPALTPSKQAAGSAGWLAAASPVDLPGLAASLLHAPRQALDPTWPTDHGVVYLGLAALPLLLASLIGIRRHGRVFLLAAVVLLVGTAPALQVGPWRWLVALVEPLQSVQKVDKAMVAPIAMVLCLLAAVGLDGLLRSAWGRRLPRVAAHALALACCLAALLANRPLLADQFPLAGAPLPAGLPDHPTSIAVQLPDAGDLEQWQDQAALWSFSLTAQGQVVLGQKEFQRAGAPRPAHVLVVEQLHDWRQLAERAAQGRPLPLARVEAVADWPGAAWWVEDEAPVALVEEPGLVRVEGLQGRGGLLRLDRRFDRRFEASTGELRAVDDQVLLELPGGADRVSLRYRAPVVVAAWGLSMLGWLLLPALILLPERRPTSVRS